MCRVNWQRIYEVLWLKVCFSWTGVAVWKWIANDTECGICRMPFDGCCPDCKIPGDDCALGDRSLMKYS